MGEIDWRQIIFLSQKELSPKKKEKLYEGVAWMDVDDIEINFGDLKALLLIAQNLMKFKGDQVDTLTGEMDAMLQREKYKEKGDDIAIEKIEQQEEEIRANKDILDQLYRDIASLQEQKDNKPNMDKESTSSKDPLSELNEIRELEKSISLKNEHLKKMLADLQETEKENVKLREKITKVKEKLTEATTHISQLTDQVTKLTRQSTKLKEKIAELEDHKGTSLLDMDGLKQELRESDAIKNATIEELKLNILYWKDCSHEKQINIDQMMEEMATLKTQLKCLKDDTYFAQELKQYKYQIKSLQSNLSEAAQELDHSANVIEMLKAENKHMKEVTEEQTSLSNTHMTSITANNKDLQMAKVKKKSLETKLADAREIIRSREEEISDLSAQIQLLHRDDGIKTLFDNVKQQKQQLTLRDKHIKCLVGEINNMSELIDGLQLENVAMREQLKLEPEDIVPTAGVLAKFSQMKKRAVTAERKLSQIEDSYLTLQLEAREGARAQGRRQGRGQSRTGQDGERLSGLDGGGDAAPYVSLPAENGSAIDSGNGHHNIDMQNLIDENEGLRRGLHEILDFIKESVLCGKSTLEIGSESLDKVTATLDARHAAGWFAPHLATSAHLQRAIGARDALSSALNQVRKEAYEVIDKLAKESQKTSELENKLLELQKDKIESELNSLARDPDEIKTEVVGTWVSEEVFNEINLEEKNSVQDVILKSVNKSYVLQVQQGLSCFHNQFNNLYRQVTDLSNQMLEERQKCSLQEEQYKAQIENLKSQIAASEVDQNSDNSVGAVHFSQVILERRCTYLEELFRNIRTMNENLKNEYLASEKEKLVKIGNYESQIQSLVLNLTSFSDRLRNSVPIDFFLKQNVKYNDLNMKYRILLSKMQERSDTQNYIESDKVTRSELEGIDNENKQQTQLLQAEREENINYAAVKESPNKQIKELSSDLVAANCRVRELEQEVSRRTSNMAVVKEQLQEANQQMELATKYTHDIEKKMIDLQKHQKDFVDRTLSANCVSTEEYSQMTKQLRDITDHNNTLNREIAKVTKELEITTLQLDDIGQRQFCNDTEVNMLRHQVLDLQSRGDNQAAIARLSGEVLVWQVRGAEMQRRAERVSCELRHEQRRRRDAEQRCAAEQTSAQLHAARYHARLGLLNEVLQILREQYDGALPITSVENYINKVHEVNTRTQQLETSQQHLDSLKVTYQARLESYDEIIATAATAAHCDLNQNDCPHYIQLQLNKRVSEREVEHYTIKVAHLEQGRVSLSRRCAQLDKLLVTLSHGWRRQTQLHLSDINSHTDEDNSLHMETQILPTPRTYSCHDRQEEGTTEGSKETSPCKSVATVPTVNNDRVTPHALVHATVQTESPTFKSSFMQTENSIEERQIEKHTEEIISLSLSLSKKEEEIKNIVDNAEREKSNWKLELSKLTERENKNQQYVKKLVQQINNLNHQISQSQTREIEFRQTATAVKTVLKEKDNSIDECRETLNKEREKNMSKAADYQKKIVELESNLDKLVIESNNLRAALLQPSNLKAMSDIVDKYTGRITELEDKCLNLEDTLDSCKSDLVSSRSEAGRWKTLAMERFNKLEQLSAKLEERHGQEVEWYRAESSHLLQQLSDSERALAELRQRAARERQVKQHHQKQLEMEIPQSEPDLKLDGTSESPRSSVCEDPGAGAHINFNQYELPTRLQEAPTRLSSGSKSVHVKEQTIRKPQESTVPTVATLNKQCGITAHSTISLQEQERGRTLPTTPSKEYCRSTTNKATSTQEQRRSVARPNTSLQEHVRGTDHNGTSLQEQRRSAAHVAIWDKWKMCERSAERWRAKYGTQLQQVKMLQGRLARARAAVQRLEKEKQLLLDRDNRISSNISVSPWDRLVRRECTDAAMEHDDRTCRVSQEPYRSAGSLSAREPASGVMHTSVRSTVAPHISAESLLARVEAQQRRIVALELASQGNETLVTEYERLLAQNSQLKKQNLKLDWQVLESQLSAGTTTAAAFKDDTQIKHLRSYVEMLKVENVELQARVECAGGPGEAGVSGESPGSRTEDLQRTILTLRGVVAKLQAENKHLLTRRRNSGVGDVHGSPIRPEKDDVLSEDVRVEHGNLKRSLVEKEDLLHRSEELLRRAAQREGELLQQISILERMLEVRHGANTTCQH